MAQPAQQIIIIRRKKVGHGGHHGGAWKVAYADFVTAMMALFIVLWLLSSSEQVQKAVGGYFTDPNGHGKDVGNGLRGAGSESLPIHKDDMKKLKEKLEQAVKDTGSLEHIKQNIVITVTGEGLRIELIEDEKLVERAEHIGKILFQELNALKAKYPIIGEVRGRGAMVAIELVHAGTKDPNPEAMAKVIKYCQSKGVLILTAGTYGNVIRFLPPVVITDELLKDALGVLAEGFAAL